MQYLDDLLDFRSCKSLVDSNLQAGLLGKTGVCAGANENYNFSKTVVSDDWRSILDIAISSMDEGYIKSLEKENDFLPAKSLIFSAFRQPLVNVKYILLGESPYPRSNSANGYAFWDSAITSIWSNTGFSKELNRATSLRNFIKMLLFIRGDLRDDFSKGAIAALDNSQYLQTLDDLFIKLLNYGFLLLNSSLIYSPGKVSYHAQQWRPFIDCVLNSIIKYNPDVTILLLGKISAKFKNIATNNLLIAEHPYNISFITNTKIGAFFKTFNLLEPVDKVLRWGSHNVT